MFDAFSYEDETFEKLNSPGKAYRDKEFEACTFRQCDLSSCDFGNTRFTDCTFIHCNLTMVQLNNVRLAGVTFRDCKLMGVVFTPCADFLFSPRFENCILDYASFMGRKMMNTSFIGCTLKDTNFTNANLSKSCFDKSRLEGALFNGSILKEADLRTASAFSIDPELNDLAGARFSPEGLPGLLQKYGIVIE